MTGELSAILDDLCRASPSVIGGVVCDFDGETVVSAVGAAGLPPGAELRALEHVPRTMTLAMPVAELLVRLAGAEPCALLRLFGGSSGQLGAGPVEVLRLRYEAVELIVRTLPDDYYLVMVLARPAVSAPLERRIAAVWPRLAAQIR